MNHQECDLRTYNLDESDLARIGEIASGTVMDEVSSTVPYDQRVINLARHFTASLRVKHMMTEHWEKLPVSSTPLNAYMHIDTKDGHDVYDSAFGVIKVSK